MHLSQYVQLFLSARDVGRKHRKAVIRRIAELERFAEGPLDLDLLSDDLMNRFLDHLQENGYSPRSIRNYRDSILAVWRDAADAGHCRRPHRIKRIKVPKIVPQGWTIDELRRLLVEVSKLQGRINRQPIARALWFSTLVRLLWDTGIRIGDALAANWDNVVDGKLMITQSKTGNWVCRRLSAETMRLLTEIRGLSGRNELLPYVGSHTQVWNWLGRAVEAAGIRRGRTREIRRSSSSHVERDYPGHGPGFLGHVSPGVFRASYCDPTIVDSDMPTPPEL